MKASRLVLGVFAVVTVAQLAAPASLWWRYERTLREGRAYKFRTAPVDPYDAFRGRYVALRYEQQQGPWRGAGAAERGQTAFATIEEGDDGFARVQGLTPERPAVGDYLRVKVTYPGWGTNAGQVNFAVPFDRYYMEERQAPKAEAAYWRNSPRRGQTNDTTYALVRVKGGRGVIEELFVGGKPIREAIRQP